MSFGATLIRIEVLRSSAKSTACVSVVIGKACELLKSADSVDSEKSLKLLTIRKKWLNMQIPDDFLMHSIYFLESRSSFGYLISFCCINSAIREKYSVFLRFHRRNLRFHLVAGIWWLFHVTKAIFFSKRATHHKNNKNIQKKSSHRFIVIRLAVLFGVLVRTIRPLNVNHIKMWHIHLRVSSTMDEKSAACFSIAKPSPHHTAHNYKLQPLARASIRFEYSAALRIETRPLRAVWHDCVPCIERDKRNDGRWRTGHKTASCQRRAFLKWSTREKKNVFHSTCAFSAEAK